MRKKPLIFHAWHQVVWQQYCLLLLATQIKPCGAVPAYQLCANKQMYIKATITHIGQSKPGLWQYRLNSLLWYNAWPEKQATLVWESRFKWIGKWLLCIRNPDTIETRSVWLPHMQWSCKLRCYSEWIHVGSARQESSTGLAVSSHIVLACDVLIGRSA